MNKPPCPDYFMGCICEAENAIHNISEDENPEYTFEYENVKITLNKHSNFEKIVENILDTESATGRWNTNLREAEEKVMYLGLYKDHNGEKYIYNCSKVGKDPDTCTWLPEKPLAYAIPNFKCIVV